MTIQELEASAHRQPLTTGHTVLTLSGMAVAASGIQPEALTARGWEHAGVFDAMVKRVQSEELR